MHKIDILEKILPFTICEVFRFSAGKIFDNPLFTSSRDKSVEMSIKKSKKTHY